MQSVHYEVHYTRNDTFSMEKTHFHDDVEIALCIAGNGVLFINDRSFPLHRGTLFAMDSYHLHRSVADENYRTIAFHMAPDSLETLSTDQTNFYSMLRSAQYYVCILSEEKTARLEKNYQQLLRNYGTGFGDDINQTITVLSLLNQAFSHFFTADTPARKSNPQMETLTPILRYILENMDQKITLDDLSEKFFLNKSSICRLFRAGTGFSLTSYLTNCRLLQARAYLRKGLSVQESGERSGFNSNEHFIRTFKKEVGMTPKKYAMLYRGTDLSTKELVSIEGGKGTVTLRSVPGNAGTDRGR